MKETVWNRSSDEFVPVTDAPEEGMKETVWNRSGRWLVAIAAALLLFFAGSVTLRADSYTYTVTISAGNQGSFQGTESIHVDNSRSGSDYNITLSGNQVKISGLSYGDVISCSTQSAVFVSQDSKYYVKGIRQSGRDNNTVADSAFTVTGDVDYVVAYGIPGDLTQYTVYYLDEEGNELAEPQTYYGNVGDKPVIAYRYIDGYIPATYNETKELVKDSSQNIFAFVYMEGSSASLDPAGDTSSYEYSEDSTEIIIETEIIYETEYVEVDPDADGANGDGSNEDGSNEDGTNDDSSNQNFSIINDVLVPLANLASDTVKKMAENGTLIPTGVGLIALICLIILLVLFLRKKKGDGEEEAGDNRKSGRKKRTKRIPSHRERVT